MNAINLLKSVTLALALGLTASVAAAPPKPSPEGFDHYMVLMAAGTLDLSVSEPAPGVTGCNGLFCDGEYFQRVIMGRDDAELALFTEDAKDFFAARFGIDVDDPTLAGRISFGLFMTNPDWQYRMYTSSDTRTPSTGWPVRDGGYVLMVMDPEGVELGGEFEGSVAAAGSVMFYGNYNILIGKGRATEELVMLFKSSRPAQIQPDGSVALLCELEHEDWGSGFAAVSVANVPLAGNLVQGVGRNVLTFPRYPGAH
ncbi:MAG TPA: hypothetical protein DDZ76_01790 [Xanthomonadales bacterium]|nr:hypothetical protein [Xanthomonadales bacterium]